MENSLLRQHGESTNPWVRPSLRLPEQLIHGRPIGVCSIYSLKELLEQIVARARELRTHKSGVFEKITGRPPTSHFHVPATFEPLLSSLELNFFLTKYFEMSDRDGRKVSVFALNYGLCQRCTIAFGRPLGEREFRLYFVERVFDYTPIVRAFLEHNQEITCDRCGMRQGFLAGSVLSKRLASNP